MKTFDFDNILKLYVTIFPFLIFSFLCLNFTCGTIYGDVSHSPYGDTSNFINFLILFGYVIAIVVNIILFCLAKYKKYFYFNLNMNIIACLVFACLPYSLLFIAFGFIIAGPLLLLFVSLWLLSWEKVCEYNSKNSNNYTYFSAYKYIFPILLLIVMLIIMVLSLV